jgi:hypothetical protein
VQDLKNLGLLEHIFRYFRVRFHDLLLKNHAAAVSHQAVALQMTSNNCRSPPVINDHLPIDKASGEYSSDRRKLKNRTCTKPMDGTYLWLLLIIRRVTAN